jgi:hypothetical protein
MSQLSMSIVNFAEHGSSPPSADHQKTPKTFEILHVRHLKTSKKVFDKHQKHPKTI